MSMLTRQPWRCMAVVAVALLVGAAGIKTATAQSAINSSSETGPTKGLAPAGVEAPGAGLSAATAAPGPANGAAAEILKMLDAGVSPEVIKVYIENKPAGFTVTADDLVMLKKRGVSDEISMALVKRGSAAAANPAGQGGGSSPKPTQVVIAAPSNGGNLAYGGVDPESYDYFRLYYLHPRALAAAYQRLGYFGPPVGYGYNRPWGYGPAYGPWGYGLR